MLDKQTEKLLTDMKEAGALQLQEMTVDEARMALAEFVPAVSDHDTHIYACENREIPGPNGPIPIRIYTSHAPVSGEPVPILLYFHGGGFVLGDLNVQEPISRYLCEKSGAIVVSVDYRLAPENPFPAGAEDCYASLVWAEKTAKELGADPKRIAVAGDSAGGNLATAICVMSRDRKGPAVALQVLAYPCTDLVFENSYLSYEEFGGGEYFLSLADMKWFCGLYLNNSDDAKNTLASPLFNPDLSNLPPALVITAGYDPLCDQGKRYAERLERAGVTTEYHCFDGTIHGFISFAGILDAGKAGLNRIVQAMKEYLK